MGDLIYDGYLKKHETYTVEIKSKEFKEYFVYFCKLFAFWFDYIKKNNVKSVIATTQFMKMQFHSEFHIIQEIKILFLQEFTLHIDIQKNIHLLNTM